jgi:hypothetical protein
MIVFKTVKETHIQFLRRVITQPNPGIGIGGYLAVTLLIFTIDQPLTNRKQVSTDTAGEFRQPTADNIFVKGDYSVLETVGRVVFGSIELSLGVGQKGSPMILVQLFQELMPTSFDGGEQFCVVG